MPALTGVMSKFCCVRASGVLEASCEDVAELFEGGWVCVCVCVVYVCV